MSADAPTPEAEAMLALAHAIRTPLTSLALGLGALDGGALGPLTEAQREVIHALVGDVGRLSVLVGRHLRTDQLGAYAGPVERISVDLGALVEHAVSPLLRQARERAVSVTRDLPSGLQAVVDPVKTSWVVACLLGNALRYSPHGGRIEVLLSRAEAGDELALIVRDQGPGIAPEVRARLFARSGGLGLFMAHEIVEAHGGTIEADAEPGRGSTFTIRLPAARSEDRG